MLERLPREGHYTGASSVTSGIQATSVVLCGLLVQEQARSNPLLNRTRRSIALRDTLGRRARLAPRWASWVHV